MDLMPKMSNGGVRCLCKVSDKILCMWRVQVMTDTRVMWPLNALENFYFIILINKIILAFLNCFLPLNLGSLQYRIIDTSPYLVPIMLIRKIRVISVRNYVHELCNKHSF
jgi:hypothetical protein